MLPLEAIALLGLLYVFFMVGTLKALWARQASYREDQGKAGTVVTHLAMKSDQATGLD
ncbi:MAG: hypothetical protein PVF47_04150 [Anaerolineae bacterium]|jgi:hypothetical protein